MSITLVRSSFKPDLTHRRGYKSAEFNASNFESFLCTNTNGITILVVYDGRLWAEIYDNNLTAAALIPKSSKRYDNILMEVMLHSDAIKIYENALKTLNSVRDH